MRSNRRSTLACFLMVGCQLLISVANLQAGEKPKLHRHGETSVAFSPDGKWIVSGGADSKVRIRDGLSGEVVAGLQGHDEPVNSVAVSPDGRTIVSGSDDGSIRIWDAEHRAIRQVLLVLKGSVNSVGFAPDGRTIASGSSDGIIRLWDVATGQMTASWKADDLWTNQVIFLRDDQTIVSIGVDRLVKFWDARTHKLQRELDLLSGFPPKLACSPDGSFLAMISNQEVSLWDAKAIQEKPHFRAHANSSGALVFTGDGNTLIVGGIGVTAIFSTRESPYRYKEIGVKSFDPCVALAVSPDGSRVAGCYLSWMETSHPGFKLIKIK